MNVAMKAMGGLTSAPSREGKGDNKWVALFCQYGSTQNLDLAISLYVVVLLAWYALSSVTDSKRVYSKTINLLSPAAGDVTINVNDTPYHNTVSCHIQSTMWSKWFRD